MVCDVSRSLTIAMESTPTIFMMHTNSTLSGVHTNSTMTGISPKALSDTLKKLENERLLTRESFAEIPPRVEYSLTNDGIELRKAIMPLLKWASKRSDID